MIDFNIFEILFFFAKNQIRFYQLYYIFIYGTHWFNMPLVRYSNPTVGKKMESGMPVKLSFSMAWLTRYLSPSDHPLPTNWLAVN